MKDVIDLLIDNNAIRNSVSRYAKLHAHVTYYLNNGHRKLAGKQGSNCVSELSSFLLPALLTYQTYTSGNCDVLPVSGAARGRRGGGIGFLRRSIESKAQGYFKKNCELIEKYIPPLRTGIDSLEWSGDDSHSQQMKAEVKRLAVDSLRRHPNDLSTYWVLASCYYKELPDLPHPMMPSADNPRQLIPFDPAEVQRLEALTKEGLNNFCERNRGVNTTPQQIQGKTGRLDVSYCEPLAARRQADFEATVYYTNQALGYNPMMFAENILLPEEAKDEIARDLYAYSLNIESWESLIYFNPESRFLDYLPRNMSYYLTIVRTYDTVLKMVRAGEDDVEILGEPINISFKLYMSNVHYFLPSIYTRQGEITENAEYLLAGLRKFKHNSPVRLISSRGGNMWQKEICAIYKRPGKEFY